MVPNLILQPIVENAIQHGIMGRVGNGSIAIHCSRENDWLRLEVKDDGPGLPANGGTDQTLKRGRGLSLTRDRLRCLYGAEQRLYLSDAPEGGMQVVIEIPYRTSSATITEGTGLPKQRRAAV
jgi:sensor histidine kinase YesM